MTTTKSKQKSAAKANPNTMTGDLRSEFKKIEWPTRSAIINASGIILLIVVLSTALVGGIDAICSELILKLRGL